MYNLQNFKDSKNYESFLRVMSNTSRFPLEAQLEIFEKQPNATVVATLKQWNKLGRRVRNGECAISLMVDNTTIRLFDISQTWGNDYKRWQYSGQCDGAFATAYCNATGIEYKDNYTFEENVYAAIRASIQSKHIENENEVELLQQSISYVVFNRLGKASNAHYDFSYVNDLSIKEIVGILAYTSKQAKRLIQNMVEFQKNVEQEQVEEVKDIVSNDKPSNAKEAEEQPIDKAVIEPLFDSNEFIDNALIDYGTGFVNGNLNLYGIIKTHTNATQRLTYIMKAFSEAGGSLNDKYHLDHNRKGIVISTTDNTYKVVLKWSDVVKRLVKLVESGKYVSVEAAQKYLDNIDDEKKYVSHPMCLLAANDIINNAQADEILAARSNVTDIASTDNLTALNQIKEAIICARQGKTDFGFFVWSGILSVWEKLDEQYKDSSLSEVTELIKEFAAVEKISDIDNPLEKCDKAISIINRTLAMEKSIGQPYTVATQAPAVRDVTNRNYDRAKDLFPELFSGEYTYAKYEVARSSCYEPLSVEMIEPNVMSLMHYYIQNGDVMCDPDICYKVDHQNKSLKPISYEQSSLGIYEKVSENTSKYGDLNRFTSDWLKNIASYDYKLSRAITASGEVIEVHPNKQRMLQVGDVVIVPSRPNDQWRVSKISDLQIDFENTNPNAANPYFSHIDFGTNRENLQETLEYSIVEVDNNLQKHKEKPMSDISENDVVDIDNRSYIVASVDEEQKTVELRDDNTGWFPLFHTEKIDDVLSAQAARNAGDELENKIVDKHNFAITDKELGTGTPREKYRYNVEAIKLLKKIESEKRLATQVEQEILSKYVGWGGLADAFDDSKWTKENEVLKELLSEEEYAAAEASTLSAFYTSPIIIDKIYEALESFGFKGGNILEPSMAVGNFFGRMPERIRDNSKLYGVELDSISGRIAQQLYQNATIQVCGYEKSKLPDNYFDVAIGNVPFGDFSVDDKRYNKLKMKIHDYFFAKTIDKIHGGGIIAFITSKGTLDKMNGKARDYISERCELIGAIRLPNTAFKSNAGTEAVSDIIFLQKRNEITSKLDKWTEIGEYALSNSICYKINQYYIDNPDMICGKLAETTTRFGYELTCEPSDEPLEIGLAKCIDKLKNKVEFAQRSADFSSLADFDAPQLDSSANELPAPDNLENNAYIVLNGLVYQRDGAIIKVVDFKCDKDRQEAIALLNIHATARDIISSQYEGITDEALRTKQMYLSNIYDEYISIYKNHFVEAKKILKNANVYGFLEALEIVHTDENKAVTYEKAPIFTRRTIRQRFEVTHCDTITDAFAVCMQNKARIDFDYIKSLCDDITYDDIVNELNGIHIFRLPDNEDKFVTADEYLSGNVRAKLKLAQNMARLDDRYKVNVVALEAVQPEWLYGEEISIQLGSSWVPEKYIQSFIRELISSDSYGVTVEHYAPTATWNITNKSYARSVLGTEVYGTQRMNALHILEHILNQQNIVIRDKVEVDGTEKFVLNKTETAQAIAKSDVIKEKFADWIWKDEWRKKDLEKIYNEEINNEVLRDYDGSNLELPGTSSEITLQPHQKNVVARAIYNGNTLIAHCVGAGKTYEMAAIAMEMRRLGISNKPLITVPNHLIGQWAADFRTLYPNANILVADKNDFHKDNRKRFVSQIATGDYDAVIMGHSTFGMISISKERRKRFYENMISECMTTIKNAGRYGNKSLSVKENQRLKKQCEARLKALEFEKTEDVIEFEQLGVDSLFVDEAHLFKNLATTTRLGQLGGISTAASKRSEDLLLKTMYLSEINGGNRGVVFGTGTPNATP